MKRLLGLLFGVILFFPVAFTKANEYKARTNLICAAENPISENDSRKEKSYPDLGVRAKSAYVADYESGVVVYAKNETERLPIASMCKIMTLILCFDEIDHGNLSMDETVRVSETAAGMGGSQVFLEAGGDYVVAELLKSIVVCSANDSCVAMAERIAGSESLFCDRMNERAKELGAENTLFANCTGLPKEPQYSCAKDVARFLKELTSHEEYFRMSKIWTDRFPHPQGRYTDISNTNRLVRFYEGCDGGKTGFTNQAGFCLAATAKRGGMRVISVVIGEESSDNRFADVRKTFDYAFANYALKTVVDANNPLNERAEIAGGKTKYITVRPERSSYLFSEKNARENLSLEVRLSRTVKAPVKVGEKVGEIVVYRDRVEIDRVNVVANESAKRATLLDGWERIAEAWNR